LSPSSPAQIAQGVLAHERRALAKAITLIESTLAADRPLADELLNSLLPHSGAALRIGISGVPGVGKSMFIEALGLLLIAAGHRVAVLAIDPSSTLSGGSILGDKTRMERLAAEEAAFIRPSPSAGTLGGVAEKTREAMLVCEAAGFDVVLVETVGVGQSETAVAGMTDFFVLLQLPNAGDDLQAMKKGIMELADIVVVNKADLDAAAAARAANHLAGVLRVFGDRGAAEVLKLSALTGAGLEQLWLLLQQRAAARRAGGEFDERRRRQADAWLWDIVRGRLLQDFREHPAVRAALPQVQQDIAAARLAPSAAARALLALFERH
jgi:LAO/AO transport system kinase